MSTAKMAALGHAVAELERLGIDAGEILRATGVAELRIALARATGVLGGRDGWQAAGAALDAAKRALDVEPAPCAADYLRALLVKRVIS